MYVIMLQVMGFGAVQNTTNALLLCVKHLKLLPFITPSLSVLPYGFQPSEVPYFQSLVVPQQPSLHQRL